ncbi:hypothetical protein K443DRAFT_680149 [Laccaria amethystina LaAM-08-1]|uniref:Uncharacterized protein n=1 Tax=Laccaria amethystina LaAM-08-1 TaxID=1095629 RepID=A0A0C9WNM6_9AGAR|nr:hypothetical protein K443DRAFT_680149 [Laccaria amethystina LaAM-08-1]
MAGWWDLFDMEEVGLRWKKGKEDQQKSQVPAYGHQINRILCNTFVESSMGFQRLRFGVV